MQSLSRRFQLSLGVMSTIVTAMGAVAAFMVFQGELSNRQIAFLGDYVAERSTNVDKRFSNLEGLHRSAAQELERRLQTLTPAEVDRLTERYFPARPDGTRRSRPEDFDGRLTPDGDYVYGMGAFIARAAETPPLEKAALAAAFQVVSGFGQAAHGQYDNFYFFTPSTRLVMFGPDRPDRLMFYRHEAPADLDLSKEEMATLTSPQNDPDRLTRCTNLQRLVQDTRGERLATACLTPAYAGGRYIGSFGSSLELTGFFLDAIRNTLPGASNLVVTSKGELIAFPGFQTPGKASEATVAGYEERLGLRALVKAIKADGRSHGVIENPARDEIVAYGRLTGPDWYLLLTYPKAAVTRSAMLSASWVLALGLVASTAQLFLVVSLARRTIVQPLRQLAATCEPEAFGSGERPDIGKVEARNDEIGVLAKALRGERDKVEEVMASLEDRVHERTAELERANAEKSRFLANMSHELRTPLNGVIAISETLAAEQTSPKSRELAELIVSSGRLLEQVLTDILDFSKIEAGEIALAAEPFALRAIVGRIAELHRAAAEAKGLSLDWSVSPQAEGYFIGDAVRLTQVLSNLLSNAVKFTEAGGVTLRVERDGAGPLRFSVSDTGIGFSDEVKARLFRRFEQADDSIRRRFGGTGLGLAISRSLVELMGGEVDVVSQPGRGSTFTISVPLVQTQGAEEGASGSPSTVLDIAGRRVLLAEDHPTNQKVVQLILQSVGVEPVIVENGALALAALRAERFDIVLMDMQMPELDGLSATASLREFEAENGLPRTPVIMLTANALDEHVHASSEAGADLHLSKPIRAAALIEAIVDAIGTAEAPQDLARPAGLEAGLRP
jgi:signal transduction histidine kinase/AmiR/NasT family two-component response regulator